MGNSLKLIRIVLKDALKLFLENDPLKIAGATAFFTMFALPPILIILVQFFSIFIDPQTIRHELFVSLSDIFGQEAVRQIVSVIRAVKKLSYNWVATAFGFIFLLFVATTVFKIIKSSINQIWEVDKQPPQKKAIARLQARLQSLGVIFVTGLLFTIGAFIETVQVFIGNYFFKIFPSLSDTFNQLLSFIISTLVTAIWFLIIFRYLNDSRPKWSIAWTGALFTSLLFSIGKIILHLLLNYNNINNIYGASASIVLLLLFMFYSAMILYYGTAFTKVWEQYKSNTAA
ncbi:MAG: YihY/virulence factor BrkB family protein [Chitinophagaceae bacterium]